MKDIENLQSHLQFQLSLLRLTMTQDQAEEKSESHSDIQDEVDLLTAISRVAQAM